MSNHSNRANTLFLGHFVPFRLNRLADAVSTNLSEIYRDRFGLEIPEWRVLVTVGHYVHCTAQRVVLSTRMHKTRVSRAVASLTERKLLARVPSTEDGRELPLRLTATGQRLYSTLAPLALERERRLLSCLTKSQRGAFLDALARLEESLELRGSA